MHSTFKIAQLMPYAVTEENSSDRQYPEPPHPYRTDFERDRDRIIHSAAFRRLEGKTQVFSPGLDDFYRTRLTHTIEVSQIGRTIAKALGLNEALTEAICLAHDLGHPPFGHAGEAALNQLMRPYGGFEHNLQTVRIVTLLEHPYPDFAGLNLMHETLLGLKGHSGPYDRPPVRGLPMPLEGQVADIADRIAYNCHDLEDARRARLITAKQATDVTLVQQAQQAIDAEKIDDLAVRRTRISKAIINSLVSDCIQTSTEAIIQARIRSLDDVYAAGRRLIRLSEDKENQLRQLESFLLQHFYLNQDLQQTAKQVTQWLETLFSLLCSTPQLMPRYFQSFIATQGLERTVCDYIAGMTDRYCLKLLKGHTDGMQEAG